MHASIEQLLQIKDGETLAISAHVHECELCRSELAALGEVGQALFFAAEQPVPAGMWQRIERAAAAHEATALDHYVDAGTAPDELVMAAARQPRWSSLSAAIYTLALSVFVTGMVLFYGNNVQQNQSLQQTQLLQASMTELMLNSRGLEQVLQRASLQNELLSDSERNMVERLHWRLQYVDQMIQENNAPEQGDQERIKTLWNERIDTLNELNQLYYSAQYEPVESEI
ncbi:MAG: hypothetical protein HKN50_06235 [Gammaproteobacteria bacterium]|nr:hypothetical protein [Gammaproteobacteria bacterium]